MIKHSIRFFLVITCCLSTIYAVSAQSLADSLRRVLATAPADTHRVNLLFELAWEITDTDTEEAEKALWEAVWLAQKFKYTAGEAKSWNGLAGVEEVRGNIDKAIEYYKKALALRQSIGDLKGSASIYLNLGMASTDLGDFDNALDYNRENLRIREELKDSAGIARAHSVIATTYQQMGFYPEAYEQINLFREYVEETRDTAGMVRAYTLMGHIRFELEMYEESRRWYEQALRTREQLGDSVRIADALTDLANVLDEMDTLQTGMAIPLYMRALAIRKTLDDQAGIAAIYNNLGDAYKHLRQYNTGYGYLRDAIRIYSELEDAPGLMETYNTYGDVLFGQKKYTESLRYVEKYFTIADTIGDEKFRQKGFKDFAKVYALLGDYEKAYGYRVMYDELRYKRLDENRTRDFERKDVLFTEGRRQREIERQQHDLSIQEAEIKRSKIIGFALTGGAIALALLAALLFNRNRLRARANRDLEAKNQVIEQERERADKLLGNILPATAAEELKLYGAVKPVRYDSATVLFSDFKGFTTIAEEVSPEELIEELDECFRLFDSVVSTFGIEKIKTIGDSYMCAGGLPTPNNTHAVDMVNAAIEMQRGLKTLMDKKAAEGKPVFEMRIGINTGPVIAGIVGSHKFAYDIWGDTVNTAARLEQGGEPAKINISETTYQLVRDRFHCVYRGKMAAKNKGQIDMYFVEF